MTQDTFNHLSTGDVIRHKEGVDSWVVIANYGSHVTAVRTADVTNPAEWDLIAAADHDRSGEVMEARKVRRVIVSRTIGLPMDGETPQS